VVLKNKNNVKGRSRCRNTEYFMSLITIGFDEFIGFEIVSN